MGTSSRPVLKTKFRRRETMKKLKRVLLVVFVLAITVFASKLALAALDELAIGG